MKGQFASFESVIAVLVVLSFASTMSYAINTFENSSLNMKNEMLSNFAVYDFVAQLKNNVYMQECFNETYYNENSTCVNYYIGLFEHTYACHIMVLLNNTVYGSTAGIQSLNCFYSGNKGVICVGVGG